MIKKIIQKIIYYFNFDFTLQLTKRKIKIPVRTGIGTIHRHYRKNWKTLIINKLLNLKQGDFIDIGANLGQTLIDFLDTEVNANYVGFEINLSCANYIKEIIELNNLSNCEVIPIGLHQKNSLIDLYLTDKTSPANTIIKSLRPGRNYRTSKVFVTSLDRVYNSKPSLIKIDVEGAELEVLLGSSNIIDLYRPIILCEILFRDPQACAVLYEERQNMLIKFLQEKKYVIYQIVKNNNLNGIQSLLKRDNFQDRLYSLQTQNLCDYLLFGIEDEPKLLQSFGSY
jgi:FkbM family methyltransferase